MVSRVASHFKGMQRNQSQVSGSQKHATQQRASSSPNSSGGPPVAKEGMVKNSPMRSSQYSASEIRAKLKEQLAPAKKSSSAEAQEASSKKKTQNGKEMKKKANDKAKEDAKNGVEVRKPTVKSNNPNNSNTHEKIKDAINNNLVDFSSRERNALSNILSEKDS